PSVPAGFTVGVYAELQAPRMMVYAPNGDLFVSSPAANNITVFRDANNDGVFESRNVYAQGAAPARRGGGGGGRAGGRWGGSGCTWWRTRRWCATCWRAERGARWRARSRGRSSCACG